MSTATFDTFEYIKTLKEKGVQPEQAEAMSAALKQALRESRGELATKADIEQLRGEVKDVKFDMLKWYAAGVLVQTLILGGLIIRLIG